tara:strand:+ start:819 stop:1499 length:681 start_codon:yes stop_codon:yes gene_type:complete
MLSLSKKLSLNTTTSWNPYKETDLQAWYVNGDWTLDGSNATRWNDSSTNGHDMVAEEEQWPTHNSGKLDFNIEGLNDHHLSTSSQITLSDEFIVGLVIQPAAASASCILGDNTTSNHFIRLQTASQIKTKFGGGTLKTFDLDGSNSLTDGKCVLTIARNSSDLVTVYFNGTAQADTETVSQSALIDTIGVNATDANDYQGSVYEIIMFNGYNDELVKNVNNYLKSI